MSSDTHKECYVWIWLPNETIPVVAGRLEAVDHKIQFNYGKSYLELIKDRKKVISIYEPELPLQSGNRAYP